MTPAEIAMAIDLAKVLIEKYGPKLVELYREKKRMPSAERILKDLNKLHDSGYYDNFFPPRED